MKAQIQDIKRALEAEAYLSALALALTIPDACGKRLALLTGKSGSSVGNKQRYIAWYKKYLPDLDRYFLSAEDCYLLRCSYLHENEWELKNINLHHMTVGGWITLNESSFSGIDSYGIKHLVSNEISLDIDIPYFCNVLCTAAEKFCAEFADQCSFPALQIINYEY